MSQLINQGLSIASPSDAPLKRRRGRPRKDDIPAVEKSSPTRRPNLRPLAVCTQGEASSAVKATASIASKGKDMMQVDADLSADDDYNNDEMVGQVVTGVLECAFDAGYFLRVRVGNSNVYMRGVVFKEGCVFPVTPENDIAPNAKMYKRRDIPIPVSFTSQAPQNAGMSISKPTENFAEERQQAQPHTDVSQKECQKVVVEAASDQQDADVAVNIEQQLNKNVAVNIEQQQQQKSAVDNLSNAASEKQDILNSEPAVAQGQTTNQTDMETVEGGEGDEKVLEPSAPVQNGVPAVLGEDNDSDQSEEEKAETEPSAELKQKEDSTKAADLEDSSEPPMKIQKTGEVIAVCSNGQLFKDVAAVDENHVKRDEVLTTTALPVDPKLPRMNQLRPQQ